MLDFEANQLQELGPYSFHNILLQKVPPPHMHTIISLTIR